MTIGNEIDPFDWRDYGPDDIGACFDELIGGFGDFIREGAEAQGATDGDVVALTIESAQQALMIYLATSDTFRGMYECAWRAQFAPGVAQ
jgi:hypothetical protein